MTSQGNGEPLRYAVEMSHQTRDELKGLHRRAADRGEGPEFVAAARQAIERLRNAPLEFGEPLFRLPVLKLSVRQGVIRPLVVDFAVHEERRLVFIRGFKLLS